MNNILIFFKNLIFITNIQLLCQDFFDWYISIFIHQLQFVTTSKKKKKKVLYKELIKSLVNKEFVHKKV